VTLSEDLVVEGAEKVEAGTKEVQDLIQMLRNWAQPYIRLIAECGVDWSSPHSFLDEYATQMLPYIARLLKAGYISKEGVLDIADEFAKQVQDLIAQLDAEEDLMRLTGQWTDNEQEIKDYWEKRLSKTHGLTFKQNVSLPMRDE
jgi:hypothetical protein